MRSFLSRAIACLQISGGLYGLMVIFLHWPAWSSTAPLIVALIGLGLFALNLWAGVALLEGCRFGRLGSQWAQALQVPLLSSSMLSYAFHCGGFAHLYVRVQQAPRLGFGWQLGSQGLMLAASGPAHAYVGVNLLALACCLLLRYL